MRRVVGIFLVFSMSVPIAVQGQDIEAPTYTSEQRWERAASFAVLGIVSTMRYLKDSGQPLEDYYGAMSDLFVPGWGAANSQSLTIIGGYLRNMALFPDCQYEIADQSENHVTARMNRPWLKYFGENERWYGVTLQEYEGYFDYFNKRLAEYKGLVYEQWTEGDWMYVKFSRGS